MDIFVLFPEQPHWPNYCYKLLWYLILQHLVLERFKVNQHSIILYGGSTKYKYGSSIESKMPDSVHK